MATEIKNGRVSLTVFRSGPYRFHFFSLEEPRAHFHVLSSEGEAKFWIEPEVEFARNQRLRASELGRVEALIVEHLQEIWHASGSTISVTEVTNISRHGFWILLGERELFLPFDTFPWFRRAPVEAILNVERPREDHLHWPELDVDLTVDSIEHPERYPLKAKVVD